MADPVIFGRLMRPNMTGVIMLMVNGKAFFLWHWHTDPSWVIMLIINGHHNHLKRYFCAITYIILHSLGSSQAIRCKGYKLVCYSNSHYERNMSNMITI